MRRTKGGSVPTRGAPMVPVTLENIIQMRMPSPGRPQYRSSSDEDDFDRLKYTGIGDCSRKVTLKKFGLLRKAWNWDSSGADSSGQTPRPGTSARIQNNFDNRRKPLRTVYNLDSSSDDSPVVPAKSSLKVDAVPLTSRTKSIQRQKRKRTVLVKKNAPIINVDSSSSGSILEIHSPTTNKTQNNSSSTENIPTDIVGAIVTNGIKSKVVTISQLHKDSTSNILSKSTAVHSYLSPSKSIAHKPNLDFSLSEIANLNEFHPLASTPLKDSCVRTSFKNPASQDPRKTLHPSTGNKEPEVLGPIHVDNPIELACKESQNESQFEETEPIYQLNPLLENDCLLEHNTSPDILSSPELNSFTNLLKIDLGVKFSSHKIDPTNKKPLCLPEAHCFVNIENDTEDDELPTLEASNPLTDSSSHQEESQHQQSQSDGNNDKNMDLEYSQNNGSQLSLLENETGLQSSLEKVNASTSSSIQSNENSADSANSDIEPLMDCAENILTVKRVMFIESEMSDDQQKNQPDHKDPDLNEASIDTSAISAIKLVDLPNDSLILPSISLLNSTTSSSENLSDTSFNPSKPTPIIIPNESMLMSPANPSQPTPSTSSHAIGLFSPKNILADKSPKQFASNDSHNKSYVACEESLLGTNSSIDSSLNISKSAWIATRRITAGKWRRSVAKWKREKDLELSLNRVTMLTVAPLPRKSMFHLPAKHSSYLDISTVDNNRPIRKAKSVRFIPNLAVHFDTLTISDDEDERTHEQIVLDKCCQTKPLQFEEIYPESRLPQLRKIGEGVFGEVFMYRTSAKHSVVLKIIPIEGDLLVNGEPQKKYDEILPEILIADELSKLRNGRSFSTSGFVRLLRVRCVRGTYPEHLIDQWELFHENRVSENDHPEVFGPDQLFVVLEQENAGIDLEAFQFRNASQSLAALQQITLTLAVAEQKLQFEHRDLHWGNILLSPTDQTELSFSLKGRSFTVATEGVKATIIDYTLSRMVYNNNVLHNDLAKDDELFSAVGDYQFDIYRLMKAQLANDWTTYNPFTNVLWLHYVVDKMVSGARYASSRSRAHLNSMHKLKAIRDVFLEHRSALAIANDVLDGI